MQYVLLFLEGMATFISPCLLPMLPLYISYFAHGGEDRKRTVINALGFIAGFTLLFTSMGAFAGTLGSLLRRYEAPVNILTGVIVIVFGLNFLGLLKIGFLNRGGVGRVGGAGRGFFPSMLFGIVFSVSWTPCVGAFLGSALMLASHRGSLPEGVLMLLSYSLGLGVPFALSALLIDRLKGAFSFIKRNYRIINLISGALLVVTGILMASGYMNYILSLLSF
ncbi:MAG: cytochrome c biogenesis CcdA family protein [Oscillospiraceae bacterium]